MRKKQGGAVESRKKRRQKKVKKIKNKEVYLQYLHVSGQINSVNFFADQIKNLHHRQIQMGEKLLTLSELRCCLLYGLYLGLLGFPATLSLCLLLEMCCNSNGKQTGEDDKSPTNSDPGDHFLGDT